jgi:hypothetical protein
MFRINIVASVNNEAVPMIKMRILARVKVLVVVSPLPLSDPDDCDGIVLLVFRNGRSQNGDLSLVFIGSYSQVNACIVPHITTLDLQKVLAPKSIFLIRFNFIIFPRFLICLSWSIHSFIATIRIK